MTLARTSRIRSPRRLAAVLAVCAAALAAAWAPPELSPAHGRQTSPDLAEELALERYLARLGLVELQAAQLERLIARELPADQRLTLARQLADLYAEQLMNSAENPERFAEIQKHIDALTAKTPQARTPALEVMLLQADYNRAEAEIARWIADARQTAARDSARETLARIAPLFDERRKELTAAADKLLKELDEAPPQNARRSAEQQTKETELARMQALAGRASYFAGWTNYYLGLAKESGAAEFARSREIFRELLDVGDEDPEKIEAESLGLESVWRARSVIGWGLAEAATSHAKASLACFKLLGHASVPPAVQDQAPYWCVQGLLNAKSYAEAKEFAQQQIAAFGDNATQGKVSLCAALVRAGYADPAAPAELRELGALGIEGLARLGQQAAIRTLIDKYSIDLSAANNFHLLWAQGQSLLAAADKSKQPADYQKAADMLAKAILAPDAQTNLAAAGKCRAEQAWCLYQLKKFEEAGRLYEKAASELAAARQESAPEALWMAFVAFQHLVKEKPRFAAPAVEALTTLKRDFPRHKYAERADYYIGKLRQSAASVEETIGQLESVAAGSPSYLAARYDICVLLHQEWADSRRKKDADAASLADKTMAAVDVFLAAGKSEDPVRIVRTALIGADVALHGQPPDPKKAAAYLSQCEPLAATLPSQSALAAEFHYRSLQLARQQNDSAQAAAEAQWLVDQAPGSAYETPALILVTQDVERELKSSPSRDLHQRAMELYGRLVKQLGGGPQALKSRKNAKIASAKFAEHAIAVGDFEQAADRLEALLAAFPDDKTYLKRAGEAEFSARRFAKSLVHWRKLLAGLAKGSPEWHEAKYYQLACLAETDRETAKKVFRQLELLYPELGPSPWREKVVALKQRL